MISIGFQTDLKSVEPNVENSVVFCTKCDTELKTECKGVVTFAKFMA